jgi:hypothetical protein
LQIHQTAFVHEHYLTTGFIHTQEPTLSSKTKKNKRKEARETKTTAENTNKDDLNQSWISMRTGMRIITLISVALGLFTSYNMRAGGWGEGLLWGLIIGGSIWLVFFLTYSLGRLLRRRSRE